MPSFIFIAFVVLKLKILKKFRGDGASMNWAIFGGFWAITLPNMLRSLRNLHHRYCIRRATECYKKFWGILFWTKTARYQSFKFFWNFAQLWGPFTPWRRPKSKNLNNFKEKVQASGNPKIEKSRPYLFSPSNEKYNYFLLHFGHFGVKKGAWSIVTGSQSTSNIAYTGTTICGLLNMQKFRSYRLSNFPQVVTTDVFFQFQTTFSSLAAFLGTTPKHSTKIKLIFLCRI